MTTEEKLQHFFDYSISRAEQEAAETISEHQKALDTMFEEHCSTRRRQAEAYLTAEAERIKRQINKTLSSRQLHIRQELSAKQQELREKLFSEVQMLMTAYKSDPGYLDFLCRKVQEAERYADGTKLTVYLDRSDEALADELTRRTGHPVQIAPKPFGGGIRAVLSDKNILIDNSYLTLLNEEKENYHFHGGAQHE